MNLNELKIQQKRLKAKIKQEKAKARAIKRERDGTFLQRVSKSIDRARLSLCERFEHKAEDLRSKLNDRDNWEANCVLEDVQNTLNHFEKKVSKNKDLTKRDELVLQQLFVAVSTAIDKELGNQDTAKQLQQDLLAIIPNGDKLQAAESMFERMEELLNNAETLSIQAQPTEA